MKKISLKNLNLNEVEQLSRAQLKDVMGGNKMLENSSATQCEDGGCSGACTQPSTGEYGQCVPKSSGDCICAVGTVDEDVES